MRLFLLFWLFFALCKSNLQIKETENKTGSGNVSSVSLFLNTFNFYYHIFEFSSYMAFLYLLYLWNLQIKATENKTGSDNVSSVSLFLNTFNFYYYIFEFSYYMAFLSFMFIKSAN